MKDHQTMTQGGHSRHKSPPLSATNSLCERDFNHINKEFPVYQNDLHSSLASVVQ